MCARALFLALCILSAGCTNDTRDVLTFSGSAVGREADVLRTQLARFTAAHGIPVELRRRVFTKFWTTGESGGSGLGMYIVGGLARAHGGWVTIDDAPAGGARVMVDWPSDDQRPE